MEIKKYCEQCQSIQIHNVVSYKDNRDVFGYGAICVKCETNIKEMK